MPDPVSTAVVHVVEDDAGVARALVRLLAAAGRQCETHADAEDFLARYDPAQPGCAIVDLGLPGMDGLSMQATLVARGIACPIVFLTGAGTVPASVRAMKAGAVDFLLKPVDSQALLAAVDAALARDAAARQARSMNQDGARRLASLTPRERQVLDLVVAGRLNKQVAADLGTAEKTVKVHRGRMMKKLGVRTVADLVRLVSSLRST
ncbi:response regulator [Amaricoccus sp.]|uniref:response regulator transcription factor n=1 Tax=Amaricoccus sp. TaxID=1872485 RepID=UPI001B3F5435|nr:response regulator [Amaricoccus sp.]MBP7240932.1 response regulator transcription factor [Amaricoccus sp.]